VGFQKQLKHAKDPVYGVNGIEATEINSQFRRPAAQGNSHFYFAFAHFLIQLIYERDQILMLSVDVFDGDAPGLVPDHERSGCSRHISLIGRNIAKAGNFREVATAFGRFCSANLFICGVLRERRKMRRC
jgi:hypothetical protein